MKQKVIDRSKLDSIHWTSRIVQSYDDIPTYYLVGTREPGKSTQILLYMSYLKFVKHGARTIVVRRRIADITTKYISSLEETINNFCFQPIKIKFDKQSAKQGIVDLYVNGKNWITIIALSSPISRIKSCVTNNVILFLFDEFIANTYMHEKYLLDEYMKFKEMYSTFSRNSKFRKKIKTVFLGNPYSLFNPYFFGDGVPLEKIAELVKNEKSSLYVDKKRRYLVQLIKLKPELLAKLKKENPYYNEDDAYSNYALNALALNDRDIDISKSQPNGFKLSYLLRFGEKTIGVFTGDYNGDYNFWLGYFKGNTPKNTYCFDFKSLLNKTRLADTAGRLTFNPLKRAVGLRRVLYQDISIYYFIQEVYTKL